MLTKNNMKFHPCAIMVSVSRYTLFFSFGLSTKYCKTKSEIRLLGNQIMLIL